MTVSVKAMALEKQVLETARVNYRLKGQRQGQALMNALRVDAPELYELLSGTANDCFYRDEKMAGTFQELGFNRRTF